MDTVLLSLITRRLGRRAAPLLGVLLTLAATNLTPARALVRLGDTLPAHPWPINQNEDDRELIVLYSHDCGDMGGLWSALSTSGLKVHAVNAEEVATPAPPGLGSWHGDDATAFARALKVSAYPTVLLVRGERVLNAWEGNFTPQTKVQ